MREDAKTRAVRLLGERRVQIVRVLPTSVRAFVRGDSGELRTATWDPRRGFRCDCPAIGASVVLVGSTDGLWTDVEAVIA